MEIIRLQASDFEDAMDLINLVFSQAYAPSTFEKMLPLLYQPTDAHMRNNFAIRENGKFRAIVGLFPEEIQANGTILRLGGIGGVSTHPNDRGKGWMKLLMQHCIQEMQDTGVDLSFLIGLRQRYQYYGYEKAGALFECKVSQTNFRHTSQDQNQPELYFKRLLATDEQLIRAAKKLHDQQPLYCLRSSSDFYLHMLSLHAQPWIALYPDGGMAGYLVCDPHQKKITELFAENETTMVNMLRCWHTQQNIEESTVILPVWHNSWIRRLAGFAENMQVVDNGNWRIFNWETVMNALLTIRLSDRPMREGILTIGIKDYGVIRFTVDNGKAECEKTIASPDVIWDAFTATRIVLGHLPAQWVSALPEAISTLLLNWFPLPLSWLPQNYV